LTLNMTIFLTTPISCASPSQPPQGGGATASRDGEHHA
jgi:hypothetical protein